MRVPQGLIADVGLDDRHAGLDQPPRHKHRLAKKMPAISLAHQLWLLINGQRLLRFIALATALLQPEPPATILIDEPELGLHPFALNTLASLIRQASVRTQLI